MAARDTLQSVEIIPCKITDEARKAVAAYAAALRAAAPGIGVHGLSAEQFWQSGLFSSAIEKLRGERAATMEQKRAFIRLILEHLSARNLIRGWKSTGGNDRYDYEVELTGGRLCAIEAKGCLDGNNTNIFQRPPNADEFVIWSLCQNPGADPRHNAWSGIHTRLGAEIIANRERVDGLIIWDMVCGTAARPCPKIKQDRRRATALRDLVVPPPCIYLFPRTIPDPRNNPRPPCWGLEEVEFLSILHKAFSGDSGDLTEVRIATSSEGPSGETRRVTSLFRAGREIISSKPSPIRRTR